MDPKDFWNRVIKGKQFKKPDKKPDNITADSSSHKTVKKPVSKSRNDFYSRIIKTKHPDKQVEKSSQKSRGKKDA